MAEPPIENRAFSEMLSSASSGNPVSTMKPSSFLLFGKLDKKFLGESTLLRETYFLTILGKYFIKKTPTVETCVTTQLLAVSIVQTLNQFKWYA